MGITGFQLKCSGALIKQEKARSVADSTSLLDGFLFGSQAQYWSHSSDVVGSSFCRKLLNVFCSLIGRRKKGISYFSLFPLPALRLRLTRCAFLTRQAQCYFHSHYCRITLGKIFVCFPLRSLDFLSLSTWNLKQFLVSHGFLNLWAVKLLRRFVFTALDCIGPSTSLIQKFSLAAHIFKALYKRELIIY